MAYFNHRADRYKVFEMHEQFLFLLKIWQTSSMKQYIFWNGKVKRFSLGRYLHKANPPQIYSFINSIKENIQLEKNKAPVIQYLKTVLEAATVGMEANYCCDHMH